MQWLAPGQEEPGKKISQTDLAKRTELFLEFLYYIFDSILIPLIRSNFHVTESNVHRNRLLYFRHDVWRALTEPSLTSLKQVMFEEINTKKAETLLSRRTLGFSQIRLLPKATGMRPIINLRRRVVKIANGRAMLGRSINSQLTPVFSLLSYEKGNQPEKLASSMFSVGDIYPKLATFKKHLAVSGQVDQQLYFVKVDVKSCFDSIPQSKIIKLVEQLVSEEDYRLARHAEVKPSETQNSRFNNAGARPIRKFVTKGQAPDNFETFEETVNTSLAVGKKNTVFIDTVTKTSHETVDLLSLLEQHVRYNIVKIGKKYFKQKTGIPQGSVLSSLLCNFFYGDMERTCLSFLDAGSSVLLRLIDDFLLITTNKGHAERFLRVLHCGIPDYGIEVSADKSLANFNTTVNGKMIPLLTSNSLFPYCGILIDTKSLEMTKDRSKFNNATVSDSLTVELSKTPGRNLHRKTLNSFKIQTHAMYLDTSFNKLSTVLLNLYENFVESARKTYHYIRTLPPAKRPTVSLLKKTFDDLVDLAFVLMKSKKKNLRLEGYQCSVTKAQLRWLAATAFAAVLQKKQSGFRELLDWLHTVRNTCRPKSEGELACLEKAVEEGVARLGSTC